MKLRTELNKRSSSIKYIEGCTLSIIALMTDFGTSEYVGVMKGQIFRHVDENTITGLHVIDITHDIPPQNIKSAAWILLQSYEFFPRGTIFCCVIDPGVGTKRQVIAVKTSRYWFVAPDNGLLWPTLEKEGSFEIWQVPVPTESSRTFHGRDVMAVAAAQLSHLIPEVLGWKKTGIRVKMSFYLDENESIGEIVHVDRFGNVITNLPVRQEATEYRVEIEKWKKTLHFHPTYASAELGELFLIKGSAGTFEISVPNGSAFSRHPDIFLVGKKIKIREK